MKIIETGWESYRRTVIPPHASQAQIYETRLAFYAGAWHLFAHIVAALEPGTEPTDADLRLMDEIHAELQAFGRSQLGKGE